MAALLFSALAACSPRAPGTTLAAGPFTWHRQTATGTEVLVHAYGLLSHTCTPVDEVPEIVVSVPPKHGKVSVRSGTFLMTRLTANLSGCQAKKRPGEGVFYTPDPGFVGTDEFHYTVWFGKSVQSDTAIISVL